MTDHQAAPETKNADTPTEDAKPADGSSVDCDGGGGALGHPRIFLTFDADGHVDCPYCGRAFERGPGSAAAH